MMTIQEILDQWPQARVKCDDCAGTGAHKPDCWLCKGQRSISLKKAYRHGYKLKDLEEVYDDYCDCPVCDGDSCVFCSGEGQVDQIEAVQQRVRIFAYTANRGAMPKFFYFDSRGFLKVSKEEPSYYLAAAAMREIREAGDAHWFTSVFGDEIMLTKQGEAKVKQMWREYRLLCRRAAADARKLRDWGAAARLVWVIGNLAFPEKPNGAAIY